MLSEELAQFFLEEIKEKQFFGELPEELILELIRSQVLREGKVHQKLEKNFKERKEHLRKAKEFKETIKKVKAELGILYGSFLTSFSSKKDKLLEDCKTLEDCKELLKIHKSTRERFDFYEEVYEKIFSWYAPEKGIADLACGFNPLSYSFIKENLGKDLNYFSSDLNSSDMDFLQKFFDTFKISGKSLASSVLNYSFLEDSEFLNCDLVFLFKALDSFEHLERHSSKELLEKIPQKRIVVSFPSQSLVSKEEFDSKKRSWFYKFLEKEEWSYESFEIENELFFLIEKP